MTKECSVRIEGHKDAQIIESTARYHKKDGRNYVFFEAQTEGIPERFLLKFDEHSLDYSRKGVIKSLVSLQEGVATSTQYVTPYGEFEVGFFTTSYEFDENEDCIVIKAEYEMTLNGQPHEAGRILILLRSLFRKADGHLK